MKEDAVDVMAEVGMEDEENGDEDDAADNDEEDDDEDAHDAVEDAPEEEVVEDESNDAIDMPQGCSSAWLARGRDERGGDTCKSGGAGHDDCARLLSEE
jgi:hypothetical protein